jgi:hypothetical protein
MGSIGVGTNYERIFQKDYAVLFEKNNKLSEELRAVNYEYQLLARRFETAEREKIELANLNSRLESQLQESIKENERLKALLNTDGTNSGLPTSKTPLSKNKVIPNSREKTDKKIGGQPGHTKRKLERFEDSEINKTIEHAVEECPACHGGLEKIGTIEKDELDYKIIVEKTRHIFDVYQCARCGKEVREEIPNRLKEENQYGPKVQALALALMNVGNVSINKTRKIISGFTNNNINLSEGYIAKLQRRAAFGAAGFSADLRNEILKRNIVYWDDTVIMINKRRACLRFYGTEDLALYKARERKDKAGMDEDNILGLLPSDTTVVHDHNKVNYNDEYSYQNSECNEHLLRDLKKVTDNLGHKWAGELSTLLTDTNKERNKSIGLGLKRFDSGYLTNFFEKFNEIMILAFEENKEADSKYYGKDEHTLIVRILDYKNEYLAWVIDFDLPFTNNLSERSLRDAKSKMKISGQFQNIKTASYYANIKSYLETCYRNGKNGFYALYRLCAGDPIKLSEIIVTPKKD